jgi:hypothetical protein
MSLKTENSRRVAKSRPVCMDLKAFYLYFCEFDNNTVPPRQSNVHVEGNIP